MFDSGDALAAVVRHATELEGDYTDIAPTVTALASCGDTSLAPRLQVALDRFLDEGNFYGRDLIAGVLAGIQGAEALPALLRASARDLGDDQDGLQAEITGLLEADRAAGRRTAIEFTTADTPELRRMGLLALGFTAEARDIELLAAAATDIDPKVRSTVVGLIPDPAGNDPAFDVLVRALRDPDEQVRVLAVSRLGYTRRADAVAPLVALATDPAPRVRSMLAYALGRLGRTEAAPALLQLLHDPQPHVREYAIDALGSVGGPAAVDALLVLATDEDPQLRACAAKALAKAADSDPRVPAQIAMLARDDQAVVRAAILSGLASTGGNRSAWAALVAELADDPDPMVRQQAAVVVRHLAPDAAPDILHQYANDPDPILRRIATTELDRRANPTVR